MQPTFYDPKRLWVEGVWGQRARFLHHRAIQLPFFAWSECVHVCFHPSFVSHILNVLLLLLLSRFSRVRLCTTHRRQPTRLPRPWDSPGKNTGVGCHFLLQCMKVKSESEVPQSCPTLSDPMDRSLPSVLQFMGSQRVGHD